MTKKSVLKEVERTVTEQAEAQGSTARARVSKAQAKSAVQRMTTEERLELVDRSIKVLEELREQLQQQQRKEQMQA